MAARVQPDRQKSSYEQELERRANDIIRVYNPQEERYVVEWDRRGGVKQFPIEAKSEAVFPRYIAEKYIKEMYNLILNDKARKAIMEENKRRVESGMAEMDKTMKTNEQMGFEEKFYNPTDQQAREIIALLYVGVESEFGVDRLSTPDAEKKDTRPQIDRVMEQVQEEKATDVPQREKSPQNGSSEAGEAEKYVCEVCEFSAKSNAGLISHKRTHRDELEKKKEEAVSGVSK